jgi:hypothetical protein
VSSLSLKPTCYSYHLPIGYKEIKSLPFLHMFWIILHHILRFCCFSLCSSKDDYCMLF